MSDLVDNPEDRFSYYTALLTVLSTYKFDKIVVVNIASLRQTLAEISLALTSPRL